MHNSSNVISVLIAIQARSNSTRFPGKIYQKIGDRSVLQHVVDQANSAKSYISRSTHNRNILCSVAILHPRSDTKLISDYRHCGAQLMGGDESNVLSRYISALEISNSDYIVRLTSDCPLILDFVISKHINVAVFNNLDYVSNVEETCRLAFDGLDCEVLSKKAIMWLAENAKDSSDLEHVTTAIRRERPSELEQGFISFKLDNSQLKLSLDTAEDLDRIREYYHARNEKMEIARKLFGKRFIFEL